MLRSPSVFNDLFLIYLYSLLERWKRIAFRLFYFSSIRSGRFCNVDQNKGSLCGSERMRNTNFQRTQFLSSYYHHFKFTEPDSHKTIVLDSDPLSLNPELNKNLNPDPVPDPSYFLTLSAKN